MDELVSGEAGTLIVGSSFGIEDLVETVEGVQGTDNAEGGAIACCSKRTRRGF